MSIKKDPRFKSFLRLTREFGRDLLLCQGGGGNSSLKLRRDRMVIKSSGLRMREVNAARGWAVADRSVLESHFRKKKRGTPHQKELFYVSVLKKANLSPERPLSMEAGFHALLPQTYVLHVHSLVGVLLGLMPEKEARALLRKSVGPSVKVQFIPPSVPGMPLTELIAQKSRPRSKVRLQIWVLKNHGVIWAGENPQHLRSVIKKFEKKLRTALGVRAYKKPRIQKRKNQWDVSFSQWPDRSFDMRPLFPDFAVYFNLNGQRSRDIRVLSADTIRIQSDSERNLQDKAEVLYAQMFLSTLLSQKGWFHSLPQAASKTIHNLPTEKIRRQVST